MVTLSVQLGFGSKPRAGIARLVVAGAVIAGLALSGCAKTSNPEPTTLKPTTQTSVEPEPTETTPLPEETTPNPTQEPSAAPTPPDPAQLINENTEEGAKSAVDYFLGLWHYSVVAKDYELWGELSTDECEFCGSVGSHIDELISLGQTANGGQVSIDEFISVRQELEDLWIARVLVTESSSQIIQAQNKVVQKAESAQQEISIFVVFSGESWLIDEVTG